MIRNAIRIRPTSLRCQALGSNITRRYAHTPVAFNWEDPLGASNLYTEEELAIQETAKAYCQERMLPRVLGRVGSISTIFCLLLTLRSRCLPKRAL